MREIKFRAWDKSYKCMHQNVGLSEGGLLITFYDEFIPPDRQSPLGGRPIEMVELMQFTGLQDKDGKEIYEGDILVNKFGKKRAIRYGEYNCGCCGFIFGYDMGMDQAVDCTVVGNIYENPELIKSL